MYLLLVFCLHPASNIIIHSKLVDALNFSTGGKDGLYASFFRVSPGQLALVKAGYGNVEYLGLKVANSAPKIAFGLFYGIVQTSYLQGMTSKGNNWLKRGISLKLCDFYAQRVQSTINYVFNQGVSAMVQLEHQALEFSTKPSPEAGE